ncbi:MAG: PAS domain-containing sensor histidine kinase [Salibacteraceae bacterium]
MALEKNKTKLYEILFSTASEGLIVANKDGDVVLSNERAAELFGYTINELNTINVDQLLPGHLKSKHQSHREGYMKNPRKRPMGQGIDLIGVRKDGSSFPIEISLNHFSDEGNPLVMALIMDVTKRKEQEVEINLLNQHLEKRVSQRTKELKESQELYKLIARNFPNGTINVFDRGFNYIFAEGGEMYKHGITSEKLMGKNYIDRLPSALRPMLEKKLVQVLDGASLKFELEYQKQHYLINTTGLASNEGKIDRILMVEQNITERKISEVRTEDALTKEKQLNELKSRFVSMASHEFRTPLSTVLSSLSLIEKYDQAGITDKKEKHYKRIRSSVRHLTNILNDFLSLEKVEAGKVYLGAEVVNLEEIIEDIVDQHNQITKVGQKINFTFEGEEEIRTDQNMIQIICSNLLSNAIKYSPENKEIELNCKVSNKQLVITVKDQGIGIPEEDQSNMFSRFFRAKNAINYEGTGLGLNIVNRYLDLLNGSISFKSIPEEGTSFFVTIPNLPKE